MYLCCCLPWQSLFSVVSLDDPACRSLCGNHTDAAEIYFPFLDTQDYFVYSIAAFSLLLLPRIGRSRWVFGSLPPPHSLKKLGNL